MVGSKEKLKSKGKIQQKLGVNLSGLGWVFFKWLKPPRRLEVLSC